MANNNLVNSLLKGLDVLNLVGGGEGMRLGEIAKALGMKTPSAHNIVRTLLARGFLERRGGNLLHIGPALLDIAAKQDGNTLAVLAEKELQKLYDILPEGVLIFGVATPQEMRQTFRISHERPRVLQRLSGDGFHPYASAAGLVGLAFASESSRLLMEERHPFAEYGAHLWQERATLEEYLAQVRKERVAICPFDKPLFFRVSTPVFDSSRHLIGVIGASIATSLVPGIGKRREVIKHLGEAAERIGARRS